MATCRHERGEYTDDYRKCLVCGQEWGLIGGVWFRIVGWVRVSTAFLEGGK